MDKEQAIDLLDNLIGMIEDNQDNDYDTAFRMAIEALKSQLSHEGTTKVAISRQAAIDIVVFECGKWTGLAKEISKQLKQLPSVQPEPKWIPCEERLPEESEYYIITANDGVGHRTTFAKFQKKAKSWDLTGARSYWRVIAWMPLPSPYQKGVTT